ncbi:MAG TPA: thioredoxin family protein [Intrasporangium sp.]|uniref:DF family (seleno)protein n=1 Tax=Intrasporangium sp. TaxID=1925024 RepID=UPI002D7A339F|nr:thioredoxin family protein [Intrasporangium sp.]HET7398307.1 thioredoxin family protein [Intrasporangium sp.]
MKVELLYFEGCPNWLVADERLRQALDQVGARETRVEHVLVSTPEEAQERRFRGSPTVLVDGWDPFAQPDAPVGLSCRLYRSNGRLAGAPTVEELVEAITSAGRAPAPG